MDGNGDVENAPKLISFAIKSLVSMMEKRSGAMMARNSALGLSRPPVLSD
jgi:hypothetical protein